MKTNKQLIDALIQAAYDTGYNSGTKLDLSSDPAAKETVFFALNLRNIAANELLWKMDALENAEFVDSTSP